MVIMQASIALAEQPVVVQASSLSKSQPKEGFDSEPEHYSSLDLLHLSLPAPSKTIILEINPSYGGPRGDSEDCYFSLPCPGFPDKLSP